MTEPQARPPRDRPTDETIKETIESIVIAFILAFVFRAYVVEAFVIPTGSMAPTLLGAHMSIVCDECGYRFPSDWPAHSSVADGEMRFPTELRAESLWACPMCRYPNRAPAGEPPRSGDRILVHKYIYNLSEPRRWDVVVFKAPHSPETNYIKRLVGLPNEELYLFQGNVYVRSARPLEEELGEFHIARKTARIEVQRSVWQPVYHSQYVPLDRGERVGATFDWATPWEAEDPAAWEIQGRRSYVHHREGDGEIRFDFEQAALTPPGIFFPPAVYPYNQLHTGYLEEPIEDVRIATAVEPLATGVSATLSTTARLNNPKMEPRFGVERIDATFRADGEVVLKAIDPATGVERTLESRQVEPMEPGKATPIELWYVDQEVSVWVDGERVIERTYDLAWDDLTARVQPPDFPEIRIGVSGPAALHRVEVDRDLYYSAVNYESGRGLAGYFGRGSPPLRLGSGEFFTIGDNGPRSLDGRFWSRLDPAVDPWIAARMLEDRRRRGQEIAGVVPRELLIGRAFFVYFPASYGRLGRFPLPNFGDMRFID